MSMSSFNIKWSMMNSYSKHAFNGGKKYPRNPSMNSNYISSAYRLNSEQEYRHKLPLIHRSKGQEKAKKSTFTLIVVRVYSKQEFR